MYKYLKIIDEDASSTELSAKDALLRWCQNQLLGHVSDVKIENFTTSFYSGQALCALIHKHRPQLIDWDVVKAADATQVWCARMGPVHACVCRCTRV